MIRGFFCNSDICLLKSPSALSCNCNLLLKNNDSNFCHSKWSVCCESQKKGSAENGKKQSESLRWREKKRGSQQFSITEVASISSVFYVCTAAALLYSNAHSKVVCGGLQWPLIAEEREKNKVVNCHGDSDIFRGTLKKMGKGSELYRKKSIILNQVYWRDFTVIKCYIETRDIRISKKKCNVFSSLIIAIIRVIYYYIFYRENEDIVIHILYHVGKQEYTHFNTFFFCLWTQKFFS